MTTERTIEATTPGAEELTPFGRELMNELLDEYRADMAARMEALFPTDAAAKESIVPNLPYAEMRKHPLLDLTNFVFDMGQARRAYRTQHGFVVLTRETVATLAETLQGLSCIEVAAGSGWLSHSLAEQGVAIVASDMALAAENAYHFEKTWRNDHCGDSLDLLPGDFDAVLLAWPPYEEPFGTKVLDAMKPGQLLVYEGEGRGGCCADDAFHAQLADESKWESLELETDALNTHHLVFQGLHDWWAVYRKI